MRLSMLAEAVRGSVVSGNGDPDISSLCYDSRKVSQGSLFFALRGVDIDGSDFVPAAMKAGAAAVVSERASEDNHPAVHVGDARAALSVMADVFNGRPSLNLQVAGVTGTNGKTTTAMLLHSLLTSAHRRCGLLGTVQYDLGGELEKATHTTPESCDMHGHLATMVANGCNAVTMEVSSHGLHQSRVADVEFDAAIFTNLSRDHLDYHGDMGSYFAAKRILFEQLATQKDKQAPVAVINIDDDWGKKLIKDFPSGSAKVITYGMGNSADFRATDLRQSREGIEFKLEAKGRQFLARIPLIGRFNVYNALGALAAGVGMGLNLRETVAHLAELPQVPGRLESVSEGRAFGVFVDYAHTPDALENALQTLKELKPRRLIVVFGCGGNRDVPKRAQMGAVADKLSNYAIITSDNPRKEDPEAIIRDVESGFDTQAHESLVDRREAIGLAISYAAPGDLILIAGKGHEDYQQFADHTIEFDDREVARQMLNDRDLARADMVWDMRREEEARKRGLPPRPQEDEGGER